MCNLIQNLFSFYDSMCPNQTLSDGIINNTNETDNGSIAIQLQMSQNWRKLELAETLISEFIDECCTSGECFGEYLNLVKNVLLADNECKYKLVFGQCDILNRIETLLHKEIKYLSDLERLSECLPSSCNL